MDERIRPEERVKCPGCGRTVSQRWNFCPKCQYKLPKPVELAPGITVNFDAGNRFREGSLSEMQQELIAEMHRYLHAVEARYFMLKMVTQSLDKPQELKGKNNACFIIKELFETADTEVMAHMLQTGKWIVIAAHPKDGRNIFRLGRIS